MWYRVHLPYILLTDYVYVFMFYWLFDQQTFENDSNVSDYL